MSVSLFVFLSVCIWTVFIVALIVITKTNVVKEIKNLFKLFKYKYFKEKSINLYWDGEIVIKRGITIDRKKFFSLLSKYGRDTVLNWLKEGKNLPEEVKIEIDKSKFLLLLVKAICVIIGLPLLLIGAFYIIATLLSPLGRIVFLLMEVLGAVWFLDYMFYGEISHHIVAFPKGNGNSIVIEEQKGEKLTSNQKEKLTEILKQFFKKYGNDVFVMRIITYYGHFKKIDSISVMLNEGNSYDLPKEEEFNRDLQALREKVLTVLRG